MNEEERISEIRARCEAATEGPWYVPLYGYSIDDDRNKLFHAFGMGEQVFADIRFVAASREDVPFLLDLTESLQNEVAKWKERHNQAALNYQQKCRDIAELEKQLSESQRREKAAVADMKLSNTRKFNNPCEICQNYGKQCPPVDLQSVCKNWEWRGTQDEKGEKE